MKLLDKKDILSSLVTGLTTGIIGWRIFVYLDMALPLGINPLLLVLVTPLVWIAGVQLGYVIGVVFRPFIQLGRFVAIGLSNTAVDFGVLYLCIASTGLAAGLAYSAFKALSFIVATAHSYYWNKHWAFDAGSSHGGRREVASFLTVAVIALLCNVTIASSVVALRAEGVDIRAWAGVGALMGSAASMIISFIGFRVFVFAKK